MNRKPHPALPVERNLATHSLRAEPNGNGGHDWIAVFDYEDGGQREFNGAAWKVAREPSEKEEAGA